MASLSPSPNIDRLPDRSPARTIPRAALAVLILLSLSPTLPAAADDAAACAARTRGQHCGGPVKRSLAGRARYRYAPGALTIRQLPASASPRSAESGEYGPRAPARRRCPRWMRGRMLCGAFDRRPAAASLPDALLVPPNAETTPLLAALGIPIIEDVPPIFILDGRPRAAAPSDPARLFEHGVWP